MNDDQTPTLPPEQPSVSPTPQPVATPSNPVAVPRITDITRTPPRPVGPASIPVQQPQPTSQPTPQPTLPTTPVTAATAPHPAAPSTTSVQQPTEVQEPPQVVSELQDQAEQSASFADTLKVIFWGFINWVAAPLLIVFILHNFVFQAYHVDGSSMTPTLHTADYMIVSKVENTFAKLTGKAYIPRRHQVVVFNYPQDPSLIFIKRVTALPGERVVVKNGTITVYNSEHPDGFNPDDGTFERSATYTEGDVDEVVPEGSIFVVGDNRLPSGSYDSREWGMLPSKDIIGNAVIRLLPLDGFRFFNRVTEVKLGLN